MPATPIYGFVQYDDTVLIKPAILINDAIQSVEDEMPHRFAASISALAAMSTGHPDGQIAVLTADDSGAKAGCTFVRSAGKWRFTSGQISNLATFISSLGSNVVTAPGAHFYDIGDGDPKSFIDAAGGYRVTAPTLRYATIIKTSTSQQVTATVDEMSFQALHDGDSAFWSAGAPNDIIIPEDGRYLISGQMRVSGGYIEISFSFAVNDVIDPLFIATAGDRAEVAWPVARGHIERDLSAGDVINMRMQRFGGVNTTITNYATWVQIRKLH